jgi:methionine synthase I (cobalamin-dependent)
MKSIQQCLQERILVIDGAMGTMINGINWLRKIIAAKDLKVGRAM